MKHYILNFKYFFKYLRLLISTLVRVEKVNSQKALFQTLKLAEKNNRFYCKHKNNITDFPVITKETLLSYPAYFKPHFFLNSILRGKTSGTTGTPLVIYRSLKSIIYEQAFVRWHWSLFGFKRRMRRATLRGDNILSLNEDKPPFWFYNKFDNELILSSKHMNDQTIGLFVEKLTTFSPYLLTAYPSTAYEVAQYLKKNNTKITIPYIFTSSEILYDYQRGLIEKYFNSRVVDFYGMAERVAFAFECQYGNYHINTDYSYVEIIDESGALTLRDGFITGTTLHNRSVPLVRYKLTDLSRWKSGQCSCCIKYPMIEPVMGKYEDLIYDKFGNSISPSILTFAFKGQKNIKKTQIAQTSETMWEVRIIPDDKSKKVNTTAIRQNIENNVTRNIDVQFTIQEEIKRTASGKFKWIVNEYFDGAFFASSD